MQKSTVGGRRRVEVEWAEEMAAFTVLCLLPVRLALHTETTQLRLEKHGVLAWNEPFKDCCCLLTWSGPNKAGTGLDKLFKICSLWTNICITTCRLYSHEACVTLPYRIRCIRIHFYSSGGGCRCLPIRRAVVQLPEHMSNCPRTQNLMLLISASISVWMCATEKKRTEPKLSLADIRQ